MTVVKKSVAACCGNCPHCLKCAHSVEPGTKKTEYGKESFFGVTFSKGNIKTGGVMSVSLNNDFCDPSWPCYQYCYARKMTELKASVKKSYNNNTDIYRNNESVFWAAVDMAYRYCSALDIAFRWHIDGEIPNAEYFRNVVDVCKKYPNVETLLMTKRHDIVNEYCAENGDSSACIPSSLHIGYSLLGHGYAVNNPYGFSTRSVIEKAAAKDSDCVCPNQTAKAAGLVWTCADCIAHGCGCFANRNIDFVKH